MSSIRQAPFDKPFDKLRMQLKTRLRQAQEVLRTGFEAEGREIPRAQQVKAAWLDKIYRLFLFH